MLARRVLHVCYCCTDVDGPGRVFVDGLAMRNTMRTTGEPASGAVLGIDAEVQGVASFVYDARGPRVSPAIEIQSWVRPPLVGKPFDEPNHVGVQALGFAVPTLDTAVARLESLGVRLVTRGHSPLYDARSAVLSDGDGVTIDLVEQPELPDAATQLHHLRITCTDLRRSLRWYEGLGFTRVGVPVDVTDGSLFGLSQRVDVTAVRLRLPDEPMEIVLHEWRKPASFGRHYDAPNHAGLYRVALGVDDTHTTYETMSAEGWVFDRPPMLIELSGTPVPDMWITFTTDPDGVPYELVERPSSAFKDRGEGASSAQPLT